ncbi:hypothetical protein OSTOST_16484, partial [Ostertagia ostertagi]
IRYCVSDGYPGSSPAVPRFTQPSAPVSMSFSNSNPGPFPNFPIPPPGLAAPPSMGALPPGVRPPSPPRMTGSYLSFIVQNKDVQKWRCNSTSASEPFIAESPIISTRRKATFAALYKF